MRHFTRRARSSRPSRAQRVTIEPNWCGQGGNARLELKTEDDVYLIFEPESDEEARALMSAASIIFKNLRDTRHDD